MYCSIVEFVLDVDVSCDSIEGLMSFDGDRISLYGSFACRVVFVDKGVLSGFGVEGGRGSVEGGVIHSLIPLIADPEHPSAL